MHTHKNLFEKAIDFRNLLVAYKKACSGKKDRYCVASFNFYADINLVLLKQSILLGTYIPGNYKEFYVYDPKLRLISAPPFIDRIVHHAICNVIEPIFDASFIYDCYACRKGKGTHAAITRLRAFLRKSNTSYALKCDISKYFASVDKDVLFSLIKGKIADKRLLALLYSIINSYPKGMPIGNLTSQLFANIYLTPLDNYVKQKLRIKYYLRYMDDFLILGNSKEELHLILQEIKDFLERILKLKLHPKKVRIFPTHLGVDFVGYVIFKSHIRLRSKNVRKFKKRLKKLIQDKNAGVIDDIKFKASIYSWVGHAQHADSFSLRKKLFSLPSLQEFSPVPSFCPEKTQVVSVIRTSTSVRHEERLEASEVPHPLVAKSVPEQLYLFDCLPG
jgi:RNA-directed DNA polymerase